MPHEPILLHAISKSCCFVLSVVVWLDRLSLGWRVPTNFFFRAPPPSAWLGLPLQILPAQRHMKASAVRSASVANRSGSTVRRSGSAVRRCGSATRSTSTTRLSNTPRNSTTSQVKTQCAGAGQTPSRMIMMSPSPRAMAAQPLGLGIHV